MENNIPTAEEFFKEKYGVSDRIATSNATLLAIEFAKLHVEACKKEIIEKVEINDYDVHGQYSPDVDRDSILNAYPLTNIK